VENAFRNRMTHFRSCNPNLLVDPANFRKGCWGGRPPTASIVPE
jgi:hypothetical protein